jgi:tRNA(Ile)-lysidine synthase
MRSAPPDAAVGRFRNNLYDLTGPMPGRLGLAVSGGPDSLAMLLLAHAAGFDCVAATVDHRLRPESAEEAQFVHALCGEIGVDHTILSLDETPEGNLSDWARNARYAALSEWMEQQRAQFLLTAHHADDQLETMMMRLNRSAGLGGLAGVRARRGKIVRPLLGWLKQELEMIVKGCGISAREDPSNVDDRFDRARLRKALASASWIDAQAASQSAAALGEAEDALEWVAAAYSGRRVAEQDGVISFDPRGLPRELLRRIVLICIRIINRHAQPRGDELDRLIAGLQADRTATLAGVKCMGGDFWLFALAPPRKSQN